MSESNIESISSNYDTTLGRTKFCKHCGEKIHIDAVYCIKCGLQVEELKATNAPQPNIIVNNVNSNTVGVYGLPKSKYVALLLCFFLGFLGVHRFYEGKVLTGLIYFFTFGLCGLGVFVDFIILLFKPDPYYV